MCDFLGIWFRELMIAFQSLNFLLGLIFCLSRSYFRSLALWFFLMNIFHTPSISCRFLSFLEILCATVASCCLYPLCGEAFIFKRKKGKKFFILNFQDSYNFTKFFFFINRICSFFNILWLCIILPWTPGKYFSHFISLFSTSRLQTKKAKVNNQWL